MARAEIAGDEVVLHLSRAERFWGFHGIPRAKIADIVSIEKVDNFWRYSGWKGLRAPGAGMPGIIALGTWRRFKSKSFCAIYKKEPGFKITLKNNEFSAWLFSAPELPSELVKYLV